MNMRRWQLCALSQSKTNPNVHNMSLSMFTPALVISRAPLMGLGTVHAGHADISISQAAWTSAEPCSAAAFQPAEACPDAGRTCRHRLRSRCSLCHTQFFFAFAPSQEEPAPRPQEPLDSYVMVEKADVLEAIGQFVAAYLASMPEAQDLQPKQLQAALTQTFKVRHPLTACNVWIKA